MWARVAEQLGPDPNRIVIAGYSMGGYAAYKLGLSYPEVFDARPDPAHTTRHKRGILHSFDPAPGAYDEHTWRLGPTPGRLPTPTLALRDVASLSVDLLRAGFGAGEQGTVKVSTDSPATVTLLGLAASARVRLDGFLVPRAVVAVPEGHHITFG